MALSFEVEQRIVPSGTADRTLSIFGGSTDRTEAIKVVSLPYPVDYKLTYSMWMIAEQPTDIIVNVCGSAFPVHVEIYWTRCELVIESPVGRDVLVTPTDATKFWLYKAQLELGEMASDWVPSPEEFNAGSTIRMNEREIYMATSVFEIDIAQGAELMHIDENGVVTNNMTVNKRLVAPNLAEKYNGPSVISLGTGSGSREQTLVPGNFALWSAGHSAEGPGVTIKANENWDLYRFVFPSRVRIIVTSWEENPDVQGVLPVYNQINNNNGQIVKNQVFESDALVINCLKTYKQEGSTAMTYTAVPSNFTEKIANMVMTTNSGGQVETTANEDYDVYRLSFGKNASLWLESLTINPNVKNVTNLAFEQTNGNRYPLAGSQHHQVFEATHLLINCWKGYPTSNKTTYSTGNFASFTAGANHVITTNGKACVVSENTGWDILRMSVAGKSFSLSDLTLGDALGVTAIAYQKDGTYYPIDTPELNKRITADYLVINKQKQHTEEVASVEISASSFTLMATDKVLNYDDYGNITLQTNKYWDVYRYDLGETKTVNIKAIDNTSYPEGVPRIIKSSNGSSYQVVSEGQQDLTVRYFYLNCYKEPVTVSFPEAVVAKRVTLWDENTRFSYENGYYQLYSNNDYDVYMYAFPAWTNLRMEAINENSSYPKTNGGLSARTSVDGTAVEQHITSDFLNVTTRVANFKINYNKSSGKYSMNSFTYTPVGSGYKTINSVTYATVQSIPDRYSLKTVVSTALTNAYSIQEAKYTTDPTSGEWVVDERKYSINNLKYILNPDDASIVSYETLNDLSSVLNNKVLPESLTVNLTSDVYGGSWMGGMNGMGTLTINGNGHTMNSNISIYNQNIPMVFSGVKINGTIGINNCRNVNFSDCVLNGNGSFVGMFLGKGSTVELSGTRLYNAGTLVTLNGGSTFISEDIAGDGATSAFMNADKSTILMSGTRPNGSLALSSCLTVPADPSTLEVDQGSDSHGSVDPVYDLTPIGVTASRTYYDGYWYSSGDSNIRQGMMNMGGQLGAKKQSGCMWFNVSSLSNVTIRSSSLVLSRVLGKGGSSDVEVYLYGTLCTEASGYATRNAVSYGLIGTIGNGETKELTIPVSAVNALKSGSIGGLMIQSTDTEVKNGRGYSSNYAVFYGAGSNNAPLLKIVAQ